jgi:hypothetical protein
MEELLNNGALILFTAAIRSILVAAGVILLGWLAVTIREECSNDSES